MYGPKVFLLTKIKPEYSDIMYKQIHLPDPLVCQIRQVPLFYIILCDNEIFIINLRKYFDVTAVRRQRALSFTHICASNSRLLFNNLSSPY
jgi:hypothetical protein